jgi:hypothetical protein
MLRRFERWFLIGAATILGVSGCAGAYRAYESSCVPYDYCADPPLPYTTYSGCHCPMPIEAAEPCEQLVGEAPLP